MTDVQSTFYKNAYSGQATNSWSGNPDRLSVVREQVQELGRSVNVLDIGCGTGLHTKWVAEDGLGTWTGIDLIDGETIGLSIPNNGRFAQVDLRTNEGWRHPYLQDSYDLVVDQGASYVSLDSDPERERFMQRAASLLKPGGRFVGLMLYGDYGTCKFPDGRVRMRMTEADVTARTSHWQ